MQDPEKLEQFKQTFGSPTGLDLSQKKPAGGPQEEEEEGDEMKAVTNLYINIVYDYY